VLGFLAFVLGILVVGGLLFLAASWLMGRGETQPPAELDRSPVELPDDRPVTADDVRSLQLPVALRGYRMTEVDWLLDRLAVALEERDTSHAAEIAALRSRAHPEKSLTAKERENPTTPDLVVPSAVEPENTQERPDA
jgi:DivIVA domain-containing protein